MTILGLFLPIDKWDICLYTASMEVDRATADKAKELHDEGHGVRVIAKRLDLSIREACAALPSRTVRPIPESMAEVRDMLGMNKTQLADALGVTAKTIARWEQGQGGPKFLQSREIARLIRDLWGQG